MTKPIDQIEDDTHAWREGDQLDEHNPLPVDDTQRKAVPIFSTTFSFWPDAMAELARHCKRGADQHNEGKLVWDRTKSPDELDSMLRHVLDAVKQPNSVHIASAIAWRAMANLQKVIERNRS